MDRDVRHKSPVSNRDFDFFYNGLERGQLLVQKCTLCGTLRNPPGPMCHACNSLQYEAIELKGNGTIYSYTTHHHPPLKEFDAPHAVVVCEMSEGVRVVGSLHGVLPGEIEIGMPVNVEFYRRGEVASFRFRPSR